MCEIHFVHGNHGPREMIARRSPSTQQVEAQSSVYSVQCIIMIILLKGSWMPFFNMNLSDTQTD